MIEWKHPRDSMNDPALLVSIDPGKHVSGYAIFFKCRLVECGMAKEAEDLTRHWGRTSSVCCSLGWPETVTMEMPQIYDRRRWKGDPNDLLPITAAGALLAGSLNPQIFKVVTPEEWKGQTPKEIQNDRDMGVLYPAELEVVEAAGITPSKIHNMIDAIGIGLWELKRNAI